MPPFASQQAFREYLDGLGQFRMQLGLERIEAALEALGLTTPPYGLVQIVGTNGKGSTATFFASIAAAHGLKVGLYTSPHFLCPSERIRVLKASGGRPLDDALWLEAANHTFAAASARLPPNSLTYFEFLTAMALYGFAAQRVDLAVLEAGLGGRNDATSALVHDLVLFTRIGLDHCHILGPSIEAIAADKAAALKPGGRALSAPQPAAAWCELEATALRVGAGLVLAYDQEVLSRHRSLRLGLAGPHQLQNAFLAMAGWVDIAQGLGRRPEAAACNRGLTRARIPGRFQCVPAAAGIPACILDGAHNPDGLEALAHALAATGQRPAALVFTCLADKDLAAMAPAVASLTSGPIFVPELTGQPRALPAREVAAALAAYTGPRVAAVASLAAALEAAAGAGLSPVLVCGSLFLLAEFFKLRPECLVWT